MTKVIEVSKNGSEIVGFKLDNGAIYSKEELIKAMSTGQMNIQNVLLATSVTGESYLRSYPDGDPNNNLTNLPEFSMGESDNAVTRRIVAVRKYGSELSEFKLDDGSVYDREALFMALRQNQVHIEGVSLAVSSTGEAYIRSTADSVMSNNLNELPTF